MSARSTMWSSAAGRGYRRRTRPRASSTRTPGGKPMPEPDWSMAPTRPSATDWRGSVPRTSM